MGIFDKDKLAKLAQIAVEKTNDAIEKQKNRNKNFYSPINGSINSNIKKFQLVGEYYNRESIESLGIYNDQYKYSKSQLIKLDLFGYRIYEYEFNNDYEVTLEYEPKNQYDPNAIMVLFNGIKVGYIAKEETSEIRQLIKHGIVGIDSNISGCRTKTLIYSKLEPKGFIETTNCDYSIEIFIAIK